MSYVSIKMEKGEVSSTHLLSRLEHRNTNDGSKHYASPSS